MLLNQQFYRFGGDHDLSDRILCLGWADRHLPRLGTERFGHRDRPFCDVQILPQQSQQFPTAQAAGQFQIEHGEHPVFLGGI